MSRVNTAKKLRSGDVKGEEQKALTQEYRKKRQTMLKARRKALSNEKIQKRRKAFQDQLLTAMKSEDSKTDQLIKEYNKARMDMRQQMRKSFSKQKGAQGQGDGGASSQ